MLSGAGMFFGMFGGFSGQVLGGTLVDAVGWRMTMWGLAVTGIVLSIAVFTLVGRQKTEGTTNTGTLTMKEILITFTSALRQPQVWLVGCGGAIAAAPVFIFGALWGVPFLMQIHGLPRPLAASLTATMLIGWGLGAFFSGWLSDKMGQRRKPLIVGIVVAMASLPAAIYLPDLPTIAIAALMFIGGLGSGVIILIFAISGDLAPDTARGSTFAFANMLMILSGAIFQPVTGLLLDLNWNGVTENSARLYDLYAYQIAFLLIPITSIVGMLMILLSRNTEKDTRRPA
jgi:MFS family permease